MLFFDMAKRIFLLNRYVSIDPRVCHGRPVFRGTRIPIARALEYLEAGMSIDDILKGFPSLTHKAVQAAIHYARLRLQEEEFIPLAKAG